MSQKKNYIFHPRPNILSYPVYICSCIWRCHRGIGMHILVWVFSLNLSPLVMWYAYRLCQTSHNSLTASALVTSRDGSWNLPSTWVARIICIRMLNILVSIGWGATMPNARYFKVLILWWSPRSYAQLSLYISCVLYRIPSIHSPSTSFYR